MERQVGPAGSNNPSQTVNYSYDAVNQLTGETATETSPLSSLPYHNQSQSFDRMGNKLTGESKHLVNGVVQSTGTTAYTANKLNQLTGALWTPPTGLPTETSYLYDTSGNLQSTGNNRNSANTTYTYDELDRLTQVVVKDVNGANTHKSEFVYDSFNRKRISREFSWVGGGWQKDDETRRIYRGMDVVQERDASNNTLVTYTRSGNIGGLLARTVKANTSENSSASDVSYYYHYDGSGNVVGLTNNQQVAVAEYSYDAWGNTVKMTGAQALNNKYRFSTKECHSSIGLYDFGYRFYNSGTGRWLNRDPIREAGGLNLYAAFANSPTNHHDEYGLIIPAVVVGGAVAVWAVVEIAGTLYDVYTTAQTWFDPCAGTTEKAATTGLLLAGIVGPGGGLAGLGRHADDVLDGGSKLFRYGDEAEDAAKLAEDAAKAKAHKDFGIHGVSTTTAPRSHIPAKSAPRSEVEKAFPVHKTGKSPTHYTVELPEPVTQDVADVFNNLFK